MANSDETPERLALRLREWAMIVDNRTLSELLERAADLIAPQPNPPTQSD